MKLRCKPNQLCRIIGGPVLTNYNKLVTTEELCPMSGFLGMAAMWHVIAMQPLDTNTDGPAKSGDRLHYKDKDLEPYADPDDTRKDETLEWLPVPTTEKEKELV